MSASHLKLSEAIAFHQQGQLAQAKALYEEILTVEPQQPDALHLLGVLYSQTNNAERAIPLIKRAIDIEPNHADFHASLGDALQMDKQWQAAVNSYEHAIDLNPNFAVAYFNRGLALQELKQWQAAVDSYDRAISIQPAFSESYANRGNALQELRQLEKAIESYDRAISINPALPEAYFNRGNTLEKLRRLKAAVESYDRAIAIKPDFADAYNCRANVLVKLKKLELAIADYRQALVVKPNFEYLSGILLYTKMRLCDWVSFKETTTDLIKCTKEGKKCSPAFALLYITDALSVQKQAAQTFINDKYPADASLGSISKHERNEKIRIGYFSADFHIHPVPMLLAEVFERHDKNRFEIIAFSLRSDIKDEMRERLQHAFDQFIDVDHLPDKDVAALAREMKLDIAVDLGGFTADMRTGIFAHRAAPIQINYLGYPGTMGSDYFDYIVADHTIIPNEHQPFYTEKIAYLPSYQPNDATRAIADKQFTRQELGLPDEGFVFCCFNDNYKITPTLFDSWMRIVKAVDGSVLFLYASNPLTQQHLKQEAESRGVDANRLIFATRVKDPSEYLARFRAVGLFLDTFPYNAHATAGDALWAGLPLLTLCGESFASRVAASVLQAIGLPELITQSPQDYEARAIELATQPDKLNALRVKLAANRLTTPLFNTKLYAQHLENVYLQMMERYYADLKPEHINVKID